MNVYFSRFMAVKYFVTINKNYYKDEYFIHKGKKDIKYTYMAILEIQVKRL